MFFKTGDPIIKNFDFLKRFGTLYNLLLDLLNQKISSIKVAKVQNEMISKIEELRNFILLDEKSITNKNTQSIKKVKTKIQRKEIFGAQRGVINNALKLYDRRTKKI